ncbi:MAG: hypothetical protein ACD_3C00170G0003 [uncultured bacterium (gcode 4)]|uniref:Glutamine-dependent NAD(+) synthetase n=1 Tax=uncultured bacterium (gcode 4) TaxID=1234023 RepID=K2G0M4_9BACT|nr:MAG: hypothetical protein ACD_3C00170G0003 [uncultured bacterium (gcode 4)]
MYRISQMQVMPGRPDLNQKKIIAEIGQAKADGISLIIFPEMAVPGYMLGDKWENDRFVLDAYNKNEAIIKATEWNITAIWWNILPKINERWDDGRIRKYNAAFVAYDWKIVSNKWTGDSILKTLMPKYREFDDERHFYSLLKLSQEKNIDYKDLLEPYDLIINWEEKKVGVIICEDMWDDDYYAKPVEILKEKWAALIINISASPFGIGKSDKRDRILAIKSLWIEMIYANNVWIQNNGKNIFVFDGSSVVFNNWNKASQAKAFTDKNLDEWNSVENWETEIEKICNALIYGIKEYFKLIKKDKVVLWLSGWVDSAVVAALMVLALGKENVITVNMPSRFNSKTTQNLAQKQAEILWIEYYVFPIQDAVDLTALEFEKIFGKLPSWLVLENIQARDRGSRVLAWLAALKGAVFTNNWNKSEIAQGYATLYWDVNWSICPIWDLYKTQVWELARYINSSKGNMILNDIIELIPSAELSENQNVDEGLGDPFNYEYLDKLLYRFVELRKDPVDILEYYRDWRLTEELNLNFKIWEYFADAKSFIDDLEKVYRNLGLFFFKRIQAPPIIAVSKRAFWYDLREAVLDDYLLDEYLELKGQLFWQ